MRRVPPRLVWLHFLLVLATAGLWFPIWYYRFARDLRDGGRIMIGPFLSFLAVTVGWILVFPPFLSWWRTWRRVADVQRAVGVARPARPNPGLLLQVLPVLWPLGTAHAQAEANRAWRRRQ